MMEAKNPHFVTKVFRSNSVILPAQESIEEAAQLINKAKNIGILGGVGCRDAREEVIELALKIKAPITHTLKASDIFDHDTDPVVGLTGLIGNPSGYKAVAKVDLLLMIGTDFPYDAFLPEETDIIQIDIRPENIGNRVAVKLGLHGHIKNTLQKLTPLCAMKEEDRFMNERREEFLDWKKDIHQQANPKREIEPIHPQIFTGLLSKLASDDAIFSIDTGTSAIWASNFMSFYKDRRIIGSFNHGSMAVGLPAAMGAQFQFPQREVWALVGDGAFNMSLHDFSTFVENKLPVKFIVFNNSQLGFVKIEMEEVGLAPNLEALKVTNFNFAEYAKLLGGDGIRVTHSKDVEEALQMAKNSNKPFIIDAIVNSGELSLPPNIEFKQAKGFGLSKAKEIIQAIKGDPLQWDNLKKEMEAFFDQPKKD